MNVDVGEIVARKYRLVRLIGAGAMGEVWLGEHESLGQRFAIKLLSPSTGPKPRRLGQDPRRGGGPEDEAALAATRDARFQFEAQLAARLSKKSPHIVQVTDHGVEDGVSYLVMEYLDGEPLEARIKRQTLTLQELLPILKQVAVGLGHAHAEGVFHRDLKPGNVFLTKDTHGDLLVKIVDFGVARTLDDERRSAFKTSEGLAVGTPAYMSPEQARGLSDLDFRCDVWALCVVAYEALTGQLPFPGETVQDIFLSICTGRYTPIREVIPELPEAADAIFARVFSTALDERFQSAKEVADAFAALAAREAAAAPVAPRPSLAPRSQPPSETALVTRVEDRERRSKRSFIIAFSVVGAAIGVLGGTLVAMKYRTPETDHAQTIVETTARPPDRAIPDPDPVTRSAPTLSSASASSAMASATAPRVIPTATARATAVVPASAAPTAAATTAAPPATTAAPPPPASTAPPATSRKPRDKSEVL